MLANQEDGEGLTVTWKECNACGGKGGWDGLQTLRKNRKRSEERENTADRCGAKLEGLVSDG